jgi:hypothetical protein
MLHALLLALSVQWINPSLHTMIFAAYLTQQIYIQGGFCGEKYKIHLQTLVGL